MAKGQKGSTRTALAPASERITGSQLVDDNAVSSRMRDGIIPVRNIKDVEKEVASGEFVKKADLIGMGPFNLIGASKRGNLYRGKHTEQIVFEVQFLEGDLRGQRALVSMDTNIVREKYYNAVKKHGGIGPLTLIETESSSEDMSGAYVFEAFGLPEQPD